VAARFAAGEVTAEQVAVIAAIATDERLAAARRQDVDLTAVEADLAVVAASAPHDTLQDVVKVYLAALDPDGPEPDPTEGRRLTIAKNADGSVTGRFDLDAVGGEKLQAALESIVQAARPQGDTRTRSQQQADALVQLCDNQLASGNLPFLRTVKPHVVVTIDVEDLADTTTTGPGAAETGSASSPAVMPRPTGATSISWPLPGARGELASRGEGVVLPHTKVHHGFSVVRDDTAPPGSRWRTYRPDGTEIHVDRPVGEDPALARSG
jgi:hypothetical protein